MKINIGRIISFVLVVVIIACAAYVSAFEVTIKDWPLPAGDYRFPSALDEEHGITKGLDLVGGSTLVFAAAEGYTPSDSEMDTVVDIMRRRLDSMAYYDATVIKQGLDSVYIEIPNISNPDEAVSLLGSTAQLTFRDYENNIIMEGTSEYVKSASATYGDMQGNGSVQWVVTLEFTSAGRNIFAEETARISKLDASQQQNIIGIYLDEDKISAPAVSTTIDNDSCLIEGNFDEASAKELASLISSGQLPFALENTSKQSVGPTLGDEAFTRSLVAGGIGLALVAVFMLIMYLLPGLVAIISLVAYIAIFAAIMVKTGITLTLPGIAGIILSIGMAVDADCVIFERLKEELRTGKTIGTALDLAFKKALVAVLDSNITTVISAAVLYYLGTGSIKGFAVTLFFGVVISMVTAIFLTRFLLTCLVKGFGIKNPAVFGVRVRRDAQ